MQEWINKIDLITITIYHSKHSSMVLLLLPLHCNYQRNPLPVQTHRWIVASATQNCSPSDSHLCFYIIRPRWASRTCSTRCSASNGWCQSRVQCSLQRRGGIVNSVMDRMGWILAETLEHNNWHTFQSLPRHEPTERSRNRARTYWRQRRRRRRSLRFI